MSDFAAQFRKPKTKFAYVFCFMDFNKCNNKLHIFLKC
jgi:hypothetical protein